MTEGREKRMQGNGEVRGVEWREEGRIRGGGRGET